MDVTRLPRKGIRAGQYVCRTLARKLKPYFVILQQNGNHGILALDIRAEIGFFAQLNWCLYIFAHCEANNLRPYIILSGKNYLDEGIGSSWFDYFFENKQLSDEDWGRIRADRIKLSRIGLMVEFKLRQDYDKEMTLDRASLLFSKYIRIQAWIQEKVDRFAGAHLGPNCLGVHYRGTDKYHEASSISWATCRDAVNDYIERNPECRRVFVASDEMRFLDYMIREIRHIPVVFHEDRFRSQDGNPIHRMPSEIDNFRKGEDALVNALLLSRCSALVRTASFLSAWASVFNPRMEIILLNRPHENTLWFPDRVFVKAGIWQPRRNDRN
jgi:hypothetical protein